MALTSISFATLYSSAQCVLSVVGSVGVILLFAGIPQLIYSPVVNAPNFLTFVMGALLIVTMFLGNILLNYKFRRYRENNANIFQGTRGGSNTGRGRSGDPEDKPPSYDTILTLDEPPPEYASIASQKPPKYEEIVKETIHAACEIDDERTEPTAVETIPEEHSEETPASEIPKEIMNETSASQTLKKDISETTASQISEETMNETPASQTSKETIDETPASQTSKETMNETPASQTPKKTIALNKIQEEVEEEEMNSSDETKNCETLATSVTIESEKQDTVEQANQSLPGRDGYCAVSDDPKNAASQFLDESET